jgi:hypothetical protein
MQFVCWGLGLGLRFVTNDRLSLCLGVCGGGGGVRIIGKAAPELLECSEVPLFHKLTKGKVRGGEGGREGGREGEMKEGKGGGGGE